MSRVNSKAHHEPDIRLAFHSLSRSDENKTVEFEETSFVDYVRTPLFAGSGVPRVNRYSRKKSIIPGFFTSAEENIEKLSPYYLPDLELPGITPKCLEAVQLMHKRVVPQWAKTMVDSWGKSDDGMRYGLFFLNYNFPGVMDQCLEVSVNENTTAFGGQYCMVNTNFQILPQKYGTCIPSSCTERDLQDSVRMSFKEKGWYNPTMDEPTVHCQTRQFETEWGTWELVGSAVIEAFVVVVVVATLLDLLAPDMISPVLKTFSASANCAKILAVTKINSGEISCFHGIRVMSMAWVILGHQFLFVFQQMSNTKHFLQLTQRWGFQIISSGVRSVDTFFFLGGILLTKGLLKTNFCTTHSQEIDNEFETSELLKKSNETQASEEEKLREKLRKQGFLKTACIFFPRYASYIFHRVARVWPGMLLTILFFAGPATLLLSGPLKASYEEVYLPKCRESWWWDLTFVTNFLLRVAGYDGSGRQSCLGNSWYLSMDMQIYLVMPFLMLPVKIIKQKQLYVWILIAISCIIPMAIIMANDLPPSMLLSLGLLSQASTDYNYKVYFMPYTRATPYFVGSLCALWLAKVQRSGKTGRELMNSLYKKYPKLASLHPRALAWMLVTAVALAVVFGLAESNYSTTFSNAKVPDPHMLSMAETFFYATFVILAWSLVLAWIVMMCALGLAEPLNFFLSHPMWQPLSRLTFGSYLISLPLQGLIFATLQEFIYVTYNIVLLTWAGVVALSFFGSFLLSLLAEAPVINLLKLLRQK